MTHKGGETSEDVQSDITLLDDSDTDSELYISDERTLIALGKQRLVHNGYTCSLQDHTEMEGDLVIVIVILYALGNARLSGYSRQNLKCVRTYGVGKTSFVNTIAAEYKNIALPTLIDLAGFPDEDNEKWRELLRIVFFGRLLQGESLTCAQQYFEKYGVEGHRQKYCAEQEALKVDRVVFVRACDQPIPKKLISCVIEAARPTGLSNDRGRRNIKFDDICLGLVGSRHRLLIYQNYCDDVDHGERMDKSLPELDVPVLRLLKAIFDPELKIQHDRESYNSMKTRSKHVSTLPHLNGNKGVSADVRSETFEHQSNLLVTLIIIAILIYYYIHIICSHLVTGCWLHLCQDSELEDYLWFDSTTFTSLCHNIDKLSPKSKFVPFILLVTVRVGILLLLRFLPDFLNG
ncbi:hypothetical protein ACJMK2_026810 [Sinanodonta woodiana]|uniref:Uncharacterized protein n=1 Tax=Sinanodonta woodiana TaxID=1069815 RepID=A0ABD3XKT9_SINWO